MKNTCLPVSRVDGARRQATLGLLLAAAVLILAQSALANTPTIRLFPTTVVEDLRQTGNVARDMETGLQEVLGRLDQQQQLYQESKCDGAEDDPGGGHAIALLAALRGGDFLLGPGAEIDGGPAR